MGELAARTHRHRTVGGGPRAAVRVPMTRGRPGDAAARPERGSATIWVLAAAVLLFVLAAVATLRGVAVLARHRVEGSADLAAVAGAAQLGTAGSPCGAAARITTANGG